MFKELVDKLVKVLPRSDELEIYEEGNRISIVHSHLGDEDSTFVEFSLEGEELRLINIFLDEDFKGLGIGTKVVEILAEHSKENNLTFVVDSANKIMGKLIEKRYPDSVNWNRRFPQDIEVVLEERK